MRTPFGSNGGGGLGGGGMMRTLHRSLRSGIGGAADPFAAAPTSPAGTTPTSPTKKSYKPAAGNVLSLSSSFTRPLSAASWNSLDGEDFDWECADGGDTGVRVYEDYVFGSAPDVEEVNRAVSALQQVVDSPTFSQTIKDRYGYISDKDSADGIASPTHITSPTCRLNGREMDWFEPSLQLCNSRALSPYGPDKVYDAFHLLQTEPCIQRMVVSLSTDKAVWDAVLNNEVVRELRETLNEAEGSVSESLNGSASKAATSVFSWIFNGAKDKITEIIEKVTNLVNELFPMEKKTTKAAAGGREDVGPFEDKLRTSFMLSIIVLLIVVVSRAHRA